MPVPTPTSARIGMTSATEGAASATRLKTPMIASPSRPVRRAPKRSLAFPPGICMAKCVTNRAVVKRPTVARPTP